MQISDALIMCFTCVAESRHLIGRGISVILCGQDLGHEFSDARSKLLFIDHVKSSDEVWIRFLADLDMLNHLTYM
jgi:hypothetical protein